MEALNAVARLTPASVFCEKRREPRNKSSTSPLKFPNFSIHTLSQNISERNFQGGLVFFSSLFNTGFAGALTYEEVLQQSVNTPSSGEASDFLDVGGILDGITNFATENPLILGGGAVVVAVPLILSQIFGGKPKPWGAEPARRAYGKLADDGTAQLLDIRPSGEVKKVGSPDIRGLKKKPVSVVYKGDDKLGFLKKLSFKFKEPENTTLIILDKFDGNSELVAELVTANGYKAAYAIKDGAEGPRGWMNSGLPWILPKKTPSLDLSNLTDAIGGWLGDSEALAVAVGIVAATGLGVLTFTEVETLLQLLGSAALVQFISTKLLFAEDRKQTLLQVDEFLNTKVAAKQLLDDVKDIGKALLPSPVIGKALPAPAEASPAAADDTVQKAEATAPEPVPQINSAPKTEVKAESLRGTPRPLSPYPYYPDFKPPTSPTPTQP